MNLAPIKQGDRRSEGNSERFRGGTPPDIRGNARYPCGRVWYELVRGSAPRSTAGLELGDSLRRTPAALCSRRTIRWCSRRRWWKTPYSDRTPSCCAMAVDAFNAIERCSSAWNGRRLPLDDPDWRSDRGAGLRMDILLGKSILLRSNHLRTVAANLGKLGIEISFDKKTPDRRRTRIIEMCKIEQEARPRQPEPRPAARADSAADVADGGGRRGRCGRARLDRPHTVIHGVSGRKQQLIWSRGAQPSAPSAPSTALATRSASAGNYVRTPPVLSRATTPEFGVVPELSAFPNFPHFPHPPNCRSRRRHNTRRGKLPDFSFPWDRPRSRRRHGQCDLTTIGNKFRLVLADQRGRPVAPQRSPETRELLRCTPRFTPEDLPQSLRAHARFVAPH